MAQLLRVACKANKLGDSGSSAVLLARLINAGKNGKNDTAKAKPKAKPKPKAKAKPNVQKKIQKKKQPPALFKSVKNGGERLSAAGYYKNIAGGKLYNCKPQWIPQPNGTSVLKKIKICKDAWGGKCPKWVAA